METRRRESSEYDAIEYPSSLKEKPLGDFSTIEDEMAIEELRKALDRRS